MVSVPEQLSTSRLILKRPIPDFAPAIFEEYATDQKVTKYMSWKPHTDLSQTVEFVHFLSKAWDAETEYASSIFQKTDRKLIAMINLRINSFRADSGYLLAAPYWGKGYMAEAPVKIRELAFAMPGIKRFQIVCDVDEPAFSRVLKKAGFEKEGVLMRYFLHRISAKSRATVSVIRMYDNVCK